MALPTTPKEYYWKNYQASEWGLTGFAPHQRVYDIYPTDKQHLTIKTR